MKRHAKNFLALFGSDGLVRLLGFAAAAYMTRAIDPSSFGAINFGMAVLSYGVLFTSPGLHMIGAMRIADGSVSPRRLVRMISSLRLILALIFCAGTASAFLLQPASVLAEAAFYFSWTLIPTALQLEWYFQGRERLTVAAAGKIAASLVFAGGVVLWLTQSNYARLAPFAYAAGITLQSLILYAAYRAASRRTAADASDARVPHTITWRALIAQSLPVGAAVITAQALLNFPSIALGFFSTAQQIAHFSASAKLIFFVLAADRIMYAIFFPFVARTHARAPRALPSHLERIARYIFLFCLPVVIGGSILAPQLLAFVYGAPYAPAAPLLRILLWYFFFTILNSLFSYTLIALGSERYYGTMTAAITAAAIALMLPLTWAFGAEGASACLVLAELALVAAMAWKMRTLFPLRTFRHLIKPAAAALIMGCFLAIFSYISLLIIIPAGAALYAAAAYALRAFDVRDVQFMKEQFV